MTKRHSKGRFIRPIHRNEFTQKEVAVEATGHSNKEEAVSETQDGDEIDVEIVSEEKGAASDAEPLNPVIKLDDAARVRDGLDSPKDIPPGVALEEGDVVDSGEPIPVELIEMAAKAAESMDDDDSEPDGEPLVSEPSGEPIGEEKTLALAELGSDPESILKALAGVDREAIKTAYHEAKGAHKEESVKAKRLREAAQAAEAEANKKRRVVAVTQAEYKRRGLDDEIAKLDAKIEELSARRHQLIEQRDKLADGLRKAVTDMVSEQKQLTDGNDGE